MEVALVKYKEKSLSEVMKAECASLVETHGAFGFPWMVVHRADGEVVSFFGSDRFSNMAWW
jgi:glutathione S-transferase kappa 1